ncbi:hypothetical protein QCA50_005599 [Cerrena zonata]|uniref:BTB domain-containing protein n=1 Tax=Cerrena zonata TaxID=2478898 RepID=A0AAW0GAT5_9APHY
MTLYTTTTTQRLTKRSVATFFSNLNSGLTSIPSPSSGAESQRKRPRSDNEPPAKISRSSDIWYEDGNIVLIAQDLAFKLHRSVLSRCSEVFRDMFEVTQPYLSDDVPMFGDSPIVYLSDTAKELSLFLKIVYSHGEDPYFRVSEVPAPMEWVSTLLRLGRKYQVAFVADEAIRRLKLTCPTDHGVYLELEHREMITDYEGGGMSIFIVNLARAFDIPELIPIALYRCCQLSNDMLAHGVKLENGTTDRLSSDDLARCLDGKEEILKCNFSFRQLLMHPFDNDFPVPNCKNCLQHIRLPGKALISHDILENTFTPFEGNFQPCYKCMQNFHYEVEQLQSQIFIRFQEIFGM